MSISPKFNQKSSVSYLGERTRMHVRMFVVVLRITRVRKSYVVAVRVCMFMLSLIEGEKVNRVQKPPTLKITISCPFFADDPIWLWQPQRQATSRFHFDVHGTGESAKENCVDACKVKLYNLCTCMHKYADAYFSLRGEVKVGLFAFVPGQRGRAGTRPFALHVREYNFTL